MRDFRDEIERTNNWRDLRALLDELVLEVEAALNAPYEEVAFERRAHDLELLLRYGERKLERLLS